jgi:hypothetical protein
MRSDRVRELADAVLLEGYVLYPYRASAAKNRWRWAFGVLAPRAWSEAGGCEPWWMEAQVLVEPAGAPRLAGTLRFLHPRRRSVEEAIAGTVDFRPVEELDAGNRLLVSWEEGEICEIAFGTALVPGRAGCVPNPTPTSNATPTPTVPFAFPGSRSEELVHSNAGAMLGRLVRTTGEVRGMVRLTVEKVAAEHPLLRVRIRVENSSPAVEPGAPREDALLAGCAATHLLLSLEGGAFVSLLDAPPWAAAAAAACRNVRTFPVLAGAEGERDLVLCAPIILYDHPRVAPESPGDFFDATEIDELLTLRTATLTEEEKRRARATDVRSAAVVDRVQAMPPEVLGRLHGALRDLRRAEMVPREAGPPRALRPGDRVRLRPGARRADAQDFLLAGCTATVREVRRDVEDRDWLAVTIDEDPAADLHDWHGRYHYFHADEVEPLSPGENYP